MAMARNRNLYTCHLCDKKYHSDIKPACLHVLFCSTCLENNGLGHHVGGGLVCIRCSAKYVDTEDFKSDANQDVLNLMHLCAKLRRGTCTDYPNVFRLCQELGELSMCPQGETQACNGRGCETCQRIAEEGHVITSCVRTVTGSNGNSVSVRGSFTCKSKNVIYYLHCNKCQSGYIGKTEQMLRERMSQHCRDIVNKNNESSVANHFNSPGHTIEDIRVCVLQSFRDSKTLPEMIMRAKNAMMVRLGTIEPNGMNKRIESAMSPELE